MSITIKSSNLEKHPSELAVLIPKTRSLSAIERKLYIALLFHSQPQVLRWVEQGVPLNQEIFFDGVPLSDLIESILPEGTDVTNYFSRARTIIDDLVGTRLDFGAVEKEGGLTTVTALSAKNLSERRGGKIWFKWRLPVEIKEVLSDTSRGYFYLAPSEMRNLTHPASIALYVICSRFTVSQTTKHTTTWWQQALSDSQNPKSAWPQFKAQTLKKAIEEINKKTNLNIELVEHKTGRTIDQAQFTVARKNAEVKIEQSKVTDEHAELAQIALDAGLAVTSVLALLQSHSKAEISLGITRLIAQLDKRSIKNRYAYLQALLRNPQVQPPEAVEVSAKPAEMTATAAPSIEGSPEVPPAPVQVTPQEIIFRELMALSHSEKLELAEKARENLARRRMGSVSITKALDSLTFSGIVRLTVVEIYAAGKYGADWLQVVKAKMAAA